MKFHNSQNSTAYFYSTKVYLKVKVDWRLMSFNVKVIIP